MRKLVLTTEYSSRKIFLKSSRDYIRDLQFRRLLYFENETTRELSTVSRLRLVVFEVFDGIIDLDGFPSHLDGRSKTSLHTSRPFKNRLTRSGSHSGITIVS